MTKGAEVRECLKSIVRTPSIAILIVLSVIGFTFHRAMESRVFPTASIDLVYPRAEILKIAEGYAAKLGKESSQSIKAIEFSDDEQAKIFLERNYGQKEANVLMQKTLPVWYWQCSFVKEGDKERVNVQVDPRGKLTNFTRQLENDLRLPSLSRDAALSKALTFAETTTGLPIAQWKLIESSDKSQIHRVDHSFKWEEATDYKGAHRRVKVDICGDVIGLYDISVYTPESWDRSYQEMRSYNELLGGIAFFGTAILALGTALLFVRAVIKKGFSFKAAVVIGTLYGLAVLSSSLNSFPSWSFGYEPTDKYSSFLLNRVAFAVVGAVVAGACMVILYGAIQPMYRKLCADRLPLQGWFTKPTWRSPQLLEAIIVGVAACGVASGYQVSYYLLGSQLGYWCPLGVDDFQAFGDAFPFLDAISVGVTASTMEEGLFRVMGLGIFMRLFRNNFWVANILQAAIWGFMHSSYPQQPSYARGVELTIEGLFDGWLLMRFGLMPCLVWHYLFDALCSVELLRAAPWQIAWTGLIPIAIPVVIFAISIFLSVKHGLADDREVTQAVHEHDTRHDSLHAEEQAAAAAQEAEELSRLHTHSFEYEPFSAKKRWVLLALAVVALAVAMLVPLNSIGARSQPLSINRDGAVAIAKQYFAEQKLDVSDHIVSTDVSTGMTSDSTLVYMNEVLGFAKTRELVESIEAPFRWSVRFCQQLSPYEYEVWVDENGRILGPDITLPETDKGARLSEAEARLVAEGFLQKYRPCYVPFQFLDAQKIEQKDRTDYRLTYAVPKAKAGDAVCKVTLSVKGNLLAALTHEWQVPDHWKFKYDQLAALDPPLLLLRSLCMLVGGVLLLWYWIEQMRAGNVRWKFPLAIAGVMLVAQLVGDLNNMPEFYSNYDTKRPLVNYVAQRSLNLVLQHVFITLAWMVAASIGFAALRARYGKAHVYSLLKLTFKRQTGERRLEQRSVWIDAALAVLAFVMIHLVVDRGFVRLESMFAHDPPLASLLTALNYAPTYWLPYGIMSNLLLAMVVSVSAMIFVPVVYTRFAGHRRWLAILMAVGLVLLFETKTKFASDYILNVIPSMVSIFMLYALILATGRRNLLAYFLLAWCTFLPPIMNLASHGLPTFGADLFVTVVVFMLPLAYFGYLQWVPNSKSDAAPS